MKPAILLIDLQNDFLRSPSLEPAAGQVIDRTSKLLRSWWASWLASVLFPLVSLIYMVRLSVQGDVFGQLMVMEVLGVVSAALGLMAAILAYFVVAKIGAFQEQAADRSLSAVFA